MVLKELVLGSRMVLQGIGFLDVCSSVGFLTILTVSVVKLLVFSSTFRCVVPVVEVVLGQYCLGSNCCLSRRSCKI